MAEDEMVGWHHRLSGHDFEQALGVGKGKESLACCSPWGHKELDTTEQLNGTLSPPEDHIPRDGDLPSGKGTKPGGEGTSATVRGLDLAAWRCQRPGQRHSLGLQGLGPQDGLVLPEPRLSCCCCCCC